MESPALKVGLVPPPDRRQSETALLIARGTARLLRSLGFACISELPLPSGRRADLVALNERGEGDGEGTDGVDGSHGFPPMTVRWNRVSAASWSLLAGNMAVRVRICGRLGADG